MVGLKLLLHDSLQRIMQIMLGICEKVVEHAMKLCPDAIILAEMLDLFQSILRVTQGGGPGTWP